MSYRGELYDKLDEIFLQLINSYDVTVTIICWACDVIAETQKILHHSQEVRERIRTQRYKGQWLH